MWLVLLLVSILGFFITREINTHDHAHANLVAIMDQLKTEIHELHVTQKSSEGFLSRIQDSVNRLDSRINSHLKQEERK